MSRDSTTATVSSVLVPKDELAHRSALFAMLGAAVVADQVVKGWAWRHAPGARINYGGNAFVGDTVSAWYADPVTGALLDLAGFGVLSIAVFVLVRRRLPVMILISGALMTGGWISNLFDRLGMHYWTAPGSVRGAVDFMPLGRIYYNVADVFIAIGTVLFLLAMGVLATKRSATTGSWAPMPHGRLRSRMWMAAVAVAVCLIGVVGFGAVNYGGVTAPSASLADADIDATDAVPDRTGAGPRLALALRMDPPSYGVGNVMGSRRESLHPCVEDVAVHSSQPYPLRLNPLDRG